MSEPMHTPGPWMIATSNRWRRLISESHGAVCVATNHISDGHPDLHFCNGGFNGPDAHLIAAAPDLLEACEHVIKCLGDPVLEDSDNASTEYKSAMAVCRETIAKAKGETP